MKTEQQHAAKPGIFKEMNIRNSFKPVKKCVPIIKTEAAGDKENCINGNQGTQATGSDKVKIDDAQDKVKKTIVEVEFEEKKTKQKEECIYNNKKHILTDITCEEEPSEHYWEILAEKRRIALQESLNETAILHKTIELLEKENNTLKQALTEATAAIEVLNEIVAECGIPDEPDIIRKT
ncbi:hypothetical protein PGB90_001576 [Kerria lacca]